jgi:hypothetical protein
MPAIESEMDRAAAVVLRRSTASVVPSPMRLPNETDAPSEGGWVSRANSPSSSARRPSKDWRTSSGELGGDTDAGQARQGSGL